MKRHLLLLLTLGLVGAGVVRLMHPSSCYAVLANCSTQPKSQALAPHYYWYSSENVKDAAGRGDKIVLFFYAPWCGTCSILDQELLAHPEKLEPGITVLKIAYDTEKDLDRKYHVTTQHTLVLVDGEGRALGSWVGGDIAKLNSMVK